MEQLDYNILFRWFVGLDMDEPIWTPTVFTKNRNVLLNKLIARSFFRRVLDRAAGLMSDEHFFVDGTLIEAWASQKSFERKSGGTDGDGRDFRGESRTNDTHASTTDPDAKLYRAIDRNGPAILTSLEHMLIENRHGLIVERDGHDGRRLADRDAGMLILRTQHRRAPWRRRTVRSGDGYDTRDFIEVTRALGVTPHVTQNTTRRGGSAIDGHTTSHAGYAQSQHARPRIEPAFGWLKTIGWLRNIKLRGLA